jgi:hypothetical protein
MKHEKGTIQLVKTNFTKPTLKFYLTRKKKGKYYKIGMELTREDFARLLVANKNESDGVPCIISIHTKNLDDLGRFGKIDPSEKKKRKDK